LTPGAKARNNQERLIAALEALRHPKANFTGAAEAAPFQGEILF